MVVKTVIVTGASKGLGLAIAKFIVNSGNNAILVARSKGPMEELQKLSPQNVRYIAGDLRDFSVARRAIDLAKSEFGCLNGLVVNHGTLQEMKRVEDTPAEEWREVYDINVFSGIAFVQAAIPELRQTRGSIIFTSSGASRKANVAWSVYGSSKAVLDHLSATVAAEEKEITTLSIAPGTVDTAMQEEIREKHYKNFSAEDKKRYLGLPREGKLLPPSKPGSLMARLALEAPLKLSGSYFRWDAPELAEYREAED